jgi:hypothetical protein
VTERRIFLAVLLVTSALAAPIAGSTENRTLVMLTALERGRFDIDDQGWNSGDRSFVPRRVPLASISFGGTALANPAPGGHTYSNTAPGLAFTLLPIDFIARRVFPERVVLLVLVLVGAALPHAAGTIGVRRAVLAATGCSGDSANLAALAHGFGTIALPMSTRLIYHALPVALLAWAVAHVLKGRGALAGLLAAWAVVTDHNAALAAASVGALALLSGGVRGGSWFALGALPAALVLGVYDTICFGAPWRTAYSFSVVGDVRDVYASGMGFGLPSPKILYELLLGTRRGCIFSQPVTLLGIAGLAAGARRSRTLAWALAAVVLVFLANAAMTRHWAAGSSFGPRYSIYALPMIALGFPRSVELVGRAFVPTAALSAAANLAAASTNWCFSATRTFECFLALGPRTVGISNLLLAPGAELYGGPAVVAAIALGLALPGAALILRGRSAPTWAVLALALAPSLATVRFWRTVSRGPAEVDLVERTIRRDEAALELEVAWHPDQARRMVVTALGFRDAWLYKKALDRVVDLDPEDANARALQAEAVAALRSASGAR